MAKETFFCNDGVRERTCMKMTRLRRERSVQLLAWRARTTHRLDIMPVPGLQPKKFKEVRLAETKRNAYQEMAWCMECGMIEAGQGEEGPRKRRRRVKSLKPQSQH